jgi:hypothetical protein
VLQNNDLAVDVARYLTSREVLSAPQREAVEKGLAEALSRLGINAQVAGGGIDPGVLLALLIGGLAIGGAAYGLSQHGGNNPIPFVSPVVSQH